MANPHGSFIWYELMSPDLSGARAFYEPLIGWTIEEKPAGPIDYRMITAPDGNVAGALELSRDMMDHGAQPIWIGYICVDDVDKTVAAVIADGGVKYMANDIPGVGRMALLGDPWGALFYVMTPVPPAGDTDATSNAFAPDKVGHCGWNELATENNVDALDFYGRHFGWQAGDVMPMGDMGVYQFLTHHGVPIGAVMPRPADGPPPMWRHYWNVADIDAAAAHVAAAGGEVMHGPADVPGDLAIVVGVDPQGAMFAVVGPRSA